MPRATPIPLERACGRRPIGLTLPVGRGNQMSLLHPGRKPCPHCGRPVKLVSDEAAEGSKRYVCPKCDEDPLRDPAAQKWVDSPLTPPAK